MFFQEGYQLSEDQKRMDVTAIHSFLTTSYWARGIPIEIVERAVRNSLAFGVFRSGAQVGFARVVTDGATFAYLADVYILEAHRGKGLSKALIHHIIGHPQLQGLRRFILATRDAHGLYAQNGFKPLAAPDTFMEILNPNVYTSKG